MLLFRLCSLAYCLVLLRNALGCVIAGTDSGVCDPMTLEPEYRQIVMPFCAPKIQYVACVPRQQSLPPDRRFEHGRWSNHTTLKKDNWIEVTALRMITYRSVRARCIVSWLASSTTRPPPTSTPRIQDWA